MKIAPIKKIVTTRSYNYVKIQIGSAYFKRNLSTISKKTLDESAFCAKK